MRVLVLLTLVVSAFGQTVTQVDYNTQVKNRPIVSDAGAATFAVACARGASGATVSVTKAWLAVPTQSCAANLAFNGGSIQPASAAVVTLTGAVTAAAVKIFDVSVGGTVSLAGAKVGQVSPQWWGAQGDCTTDDTVAWTAAVAASSGKVLDGGGACYATTSAAIPIAVSNAVIQNFRMKVNRAAPAGANSYESSGLYYAGDINQKNVTIQNFEFSGTGYWSGIESSVIYYVEGWAGGVYLSINTLNYQARKNMTIQNGTCTNPYYECVFTTNVQTLMYNLRADGCQNITDTACFESRATTAIVFDGIKVIEGYGKAVSSSYAYGAKYNNVQTVNLTVSGGAIYVGYFNQDSNVTNCSVYLTNADPDAGFLKASYYSQRTTVTGCTFTGSGYVMFQGAKDFTFTGNTIKTSGYRGLRLLYHAIISFGPENIQNQGGVISGNYISGCLLAGCSVVTTATSPRIVDMSNCQNCVFGNNNVIGNIVANPSYDLAVTNNMVDFSPTGYLTPIPAVYLLALNNGRISGNRILSGWTAGTTTIAVAGTLDAATMTVSSNEFTVPTDAINYGVSASTTAFDATSIFRYSNNTALNVPPGSQYELGTSNFTAANSYISYIQKYIQGISTAIGGAPLLAGACAADSAVIATGAATGDFVLATPTTYPGDGFFMAPPIVTGANTVTVKVCASVAGTPTATTVRVRVFPYRP